MDNTKAHKTSNAECCFKNIVDRQIEILNSTLLAFKKVFLLNRLQ